MEKKCKKAKCLSEEALQIAMKRREVKSKGENENYSYLNSEFQRIARRDKKTFLSDQCKEIDENNRMGKTRDLFKEIRDTKGISVKVRCSLIPGASFTFWSDLNGVPRTALWMKCCCLNIVSVVSGGQVLAMTLPHSGADWQPFLH